jgi:hypothetical protein
VMTIQNHEEGAVIQPGGMHHRHKRGSSSNNNNNNNNNNKACTSDGWSVLCSVSLGMTWYAYIGPIEMPPMACGSCQHGMRVDRDETLV